MARPLKTRGMLELDSLRKRVERQRNLGRISGFDRRWLVDHLNEIESHIIGMSETNEEGEEEG